MPFHTITFAALLAVASTAFAAGNHGHDHTAKHGGIAVETKQAGLEIVARPDLIQIYVDDHGKPVNLDGAKAKVTLLNGTETSEVALASRRRQTGSQRRLQGGQRHQRRGRRHAGGQAPGDRAV